MLGENYSNHRKVAFLDRRLWAATRVTCRELRLALVQAECPVRAAVSQNPQSAQDTFTGLRGL